jgi:hypothetical protein
MYYIILYILDYTFYIIYYLLYYILYIIYYILYIIFYILYTIYCIILHYTILYCIILYYIMLYLYCMYTHYMVDFAAHHAWWPEGIYKSTSRTWAPRVFFWLDGSEPCSTMLRATGIACALRKPMAMTWSGPRVIGIRIIHDFLSESYNPIGKVWKSIDGRIHFSG